MINKKIALVLAIAVFLLALIFASGFLQRQYIKSEIEKANYCTVDSDCVSVCTESCDLNSAVFVNKKESARIKQLVENYPGDVCYYETCFSEELVICPNGKCVLDMGR